ncbi:fibronectin type III domain-containing protein [Micromonospora sp. NPDC049559]|uniref:fibronectin type III domain-containing protein n=1 Tax=Micromonospora sp. NPDC049559 TaxID=3155923 RepID=UPI00344A341F
MLTSRPRHTWAAVTAVAVATTGLVVIGGGSAYAMDPIDVTDVPGALTAEWNDWAGEEADKSIDNTPYSKYFTLHSTTWLQYLAANPTTVTGYRITSANDFPDRDPRSWVFEASPNGTTWVTLDSRSDQRFVARHSRKSYTFPNTTAYHYYRLRITANAGAAGTQLAEWQILGTTTATTPPPSAPSGLTAQVVSGDQIVLSWQDNTRWETRYRIERSIDGTNWNWSRDLPVGTTRFHGLGLSGNTRYHYRVRAENGTGRSGYATVDATTGDPNLPATWQEHWNEHVQPLTRTTYNDDVGVYLDPDVDPAQAGWLDTFTTAMWRYTKQTYGSFSNPRLAAIFHEGRYGGGHPANVFDGHHDHRNVIDIGVDNWNQATDWHRDIIVHEIGHIVEGSSLGVRNSPAFPIWNDSAWCEIYGYDMYVNLGMTADANRAYHHLVTATYDNPRTDTYWFRDWFYPIWRDHGRTAPLTNFFELLAANFHQHNGAYARDLNWGEFVHFWSGAAGVNLKPLATTAFGWPAEWEHQFVQAQHDFPGVTYPQG